MPNPQFIIDEVLPAMQQALGASNVMQEAAASEPKVGHFDPANSARAEPLLQEALVVVQPNFSPEM